MLHNHPLTFLLKCTVEGGDGVWAGPGGAGRLLHPRRSSACAPHPCEASGCLGQELGAKKPLRQEQGHCCGFFSCREPSTTLIVMLKSDQLLQE